MREERKLNKAIQQDGVDTQTDVFEELKRRYPQYVKQAESKPVAVRKKRMAVFSAFAAVAACAAIVVPCAVLLPNRGNNGDDNIGYCASCGYYVYASEYTLAEYRENNGLDFLCFDWYELAEDINTVYYTSKSDNEIVCLQEDAHILQSGEIVTLSITKSDVYLSEFYKVIVDIGCERVVKDHTVKWVTNDKKIIGTLEDGGYRYFIQIEQTQDEERLLELVAELLDTKNL